MSVIAGPPRRRIYYGWVLVLTLAITETTSFGVLYYAFTVFIDPMQEDLGWSRAALTGAFSLAQLVSGIAAIPVGRWLDRHGPRLLMTAGSCVAALLVLAWSRVEHLPAFYLIWAAVGVAGAAVLYEPAFVVVANWFVRRRSRALTVLTFIAGFASVIYIPLASWLVEAQGWRDALITLALILAVGTILPHALILRRRPADMGLEPDGNSPTNKGDTQHGAPSPQHSAERSVPVREALRGTVFRWLAAAFFLNALGQIALHVHLVPYLTGRGYSAGFAATMAGLVGIMALPGRLIFTPLGDRVPRAYLTALIFSLQAIALVVLLLAQSTAGVFTYVFLFGAGFGAVTPMRAALVAEFYGSAFYGSISGVLAFVITIARALGPVSVGVAYDRFGGYTVPFWVLVGASVAAAVAILLAERAAARSASDA
ncbi:MAG: MFS transporter [Dehalococcoidia bacterium]